MEQTNNSNLLKSTITSGAILAAALLIFTLIIYMTNLMFSTGINLLSYLILIGGIILGIKNYKDQQGGFVSYARALGVGMLTVTFASIIVAIFIYILYSVIDPGLIEKSMEIARNKMLEKHMSDDQIEMGMNISKKFMNPAILAVGTIIGYAFFGLIFSLIIAAFMKKEKGIFSDTLENNQQ